MSCIKKGLIQKYIDNEATPKEAVLIEKHIANCHKCAAKVNKHKKIASNIISAINKLVDDYCEIPDFILPTVSVKKQIVDKKRIIYSISAACALFLIFLLVTTYNSKDECQVNIVQSMEPEVDANRPITDQKLTLNVIDPQGNVTEIDID